IRLRNNALTSRLFHLFTAAVPIQGWSAISNRAFSGPLNLSDRFGRSFFALVIGQLIERYAAVLEAFLRSTFQIFDVDAEVMEPREIHPMIDLVLIKLQHGNVDVTVGQHHAAGSRVVESPYFR